MSAPINHNMLAVTFDHIPLYIQPPKVPRHITLLPWYPDVPGVGVGIRQFIKESEPFTITAGEQMICGAPGYEKPAKRVYSEGLTQLHNRLYEYLSKSGVVFPNPEYLGDNYSPHYRLTESQDPFAEVSEVYVDEIALIKNIKLSHIRSLPPKKITSYESLRR